MRKYYQEAYEFTKMIINNTSLTDTVIPQNAIKSDGTKFKEFQSDTTRVLRISTNNNPEEREASFNQHKREVMKLSIQSNLYDAIKVYNEHAPSMGTHTNFRMPVLTDEDWEKILTNVNVISFMQGAPVGTKLYNNYAIVTSTQNKQYINPNSLYFVDNSNTYHRINCPILDKNVKNGSGVIGYKSIDFKKIQNTNDSTKYEYKHKEYACYTCLVNSLSEELNINSLSQTLKQAYYEALAKERYNLDRATEMLKYTKTN
ncbi:MAG: hypothetical protein HFJ27_06435 [Clostridia bacterium]|nr:hypothetical protein [Clostridia bacterium]